MPGRQSSLIDTIESLAGQHDRLRIYANGITNTSFLDAYDCEVFTGEDLGDAGKFYTVGRLKKGVYVTCDDDLLYPEDFVERLLVGLDVYPGAVVGFHGWDAKPNSQSYHRDRAINYHFRQTIEDAHYCHVIGTGCTAFRVGDIKVSLSDFERPNMADLWLSKLCNEQGVPRVVLPHERDWIQYCEKVDMGSTIWGKASRDPEKERFQTDLLNRIEWEKHELNGIH
ncbi:MAG TPA: hypothetical protein VKP65_03990 [Rhodothermales bacterium]|nr:hypothetical protein [Rhodothermales bacterium]